MRCHNSIINTQNRSIVVNIIFNLYYMHCCSLDDSTRGLSDIRYAGVRWSAVSPYAADAGHGGYRGREAAKLRGL